MIPSSSHFVIKCLKIHEVRNRHNIVQSLIMETNALQKTLDGVEDDDERRSLEEDITGKVRFRI